MPTSALGLLSYNSVHPVEDIIGKDSAPMTVYGHSGCTNGSVATVFLIPGSRSAVVVLSNAADAGDASETTAQILLQALFDLKPKVNLIPSLEASRDDRLKMHEDMIKSWSKHRDISRYDGRPEELLGTYRGLGASVINIVKSHSSKSGLAVVFADQEQSRCELEPFNQDSLTFLPMEHDEILAKGMIDWDYWTVGVFRFVRDKNDNQQNTIVGFRWKWDQYDDCGLWVKEKDNMAETDYDAIVEKHGKFVKENFLYE